MQFASYGAPGGTRTSGLVLRKHTLYPLSYGRFSSVHREFTASYSSK